MLVLQKSIRHAFNNFQLYLSFLIHKTLIETSTLCIFLSTGTLTETFFLF